MHLQAKPSRVCIVGDSQIGSVKLAHDAGLIAWPDGAEIEYWGAKGALFRDIRWQDGGVVAEGDAREAVQQINAKGRDRLKPDDFDLFVFYGARLRVAEFFGPWLDWRQNHEAFPSTAVLAQSAQSFLLCTRAFRIACSLAQSGAQVAFLPAPFLTDGIIQKSGNAGFLEAYPRATEATSEERAHLWAALARFAAEAGVTLVPQPDETVVQGVLTDAQYAREGAAAMLDPGHKSREFAALWLGVFWAEVEASMQTTRKCA